MRKLSTCILFFTTSFVISQQSFISIISSFNEEHEIVENVDVIVEKEYSLYNQTGEDQPDTTVFIDENEQSLFLRGMVTSKYLSPYERLDTHSKPDGSISHTFHTKFRKDGKVTYQQQDYGSSPAADMLNSKVEYKYDELGRVVSILNNDQEYFNIKYKSEYIVEEFTMDAGIGIMQAVSEQIEDTLRYDLKMQMSEEFSALMGDEKIPREYMDLVIENELYCYYNYKEDPTSKNIDLQSVYIFDENLNPVEEKVADYSGEMSHLKYVYDETGTIKEVVNVKEKTKLEWEYDAMGKILVEHEAGSSLEHSYDDNGHIIQTIVREASNGSISSVKFKQINYTSNETIQDAR